MMPFSKDLLTNDVPTTRRYLQLTLINIRDELRQAHGRGRYGGEAAISLRCAGSTKH